MQHCSKLGIVEDKPLMFDYWTYSLEGKALLVLKKIVKSYCKGEDEYTSPIVKIFKVENEFIVVTENSIYIVSSDNTKRIS